jgi:hypothetical protein
MCLKSGGPEGSPAKASVIIQQKLVPHFQPSRCYLWLPANSPA